MNASVNSPAPLCSLSCYSWSDKITIHSISAGELFYITDWEGELRTPGYPNTYPTKSNLTWIKSVSPGNRIKITVQDLEVKNTANLNNIILK